MTLMLAAATIGGGTAGAYFSRTASGIAFGAGSSMFCGTLVYLNSMLKTSGIPSYPFMAGLITKWAVAALATTISWAADALLLDDYSPQLRVSVSSTLFLAIFLITGRIVLANEMVQVAQIMPTGIRSIFLRVMRFPPKSAAPGAGSL
jgi:hypothetical protein